jgi:signal transduction histidine kinase
MCLKWRNSFLLSFLLFTFYAQATEIHISSESEPLLISNQMSVFLDTTENLSIEEAANKSELFSRNYTDVINAQVTSSTVWLKFQIDNKTNLNELLLEIRTSNIDEVTLYKQEDDHFSSEGPYGQAFLYNTRFYNHPNFLFTLNLRSGEQATYYLRVKNQDQITLPIQVGSRKSIIEGIFNYDVSNGIYLGIFIIMFFYNLFLYFAIRNKYYIFYSLFVFTLGLGLFTISGYSFKYIWPESPWIETRAVVMISALIPITALIFANSFLNLKESLPIARKILLAFVLGYGAVLILALFGFVATGQKGIILLSPSIFILLVIAIILARKGIRNAKFFLVSWTVYLIGIVVFLLKDFGVIPYNTITSKLMHFGSVLEVLLLSFALADYINILRKEKEESQKKVLKGLQRNEQIIKSQNKMLEKKVQERTLKLETTNLDLSQAMNELKDTQTQLVDAEKMASLGQLTAGIAHEINNPINFVSSNISPLKKDIDDLREIIARYETATTEEGISAAQTKLIRELKEEIDLDFTLVEIDELLHGIKDGADRTAEIVKGLKNFSRLDESLIKAADINEGIKSTLLILKSKFSSIKLVEDYGDLVPIHCLPGKLNQLFMNILDNAIYACTKKEYPAESTARITIVTNQSKTSTTIQIKDNGIGMDNQTKTKIFEPFFTTKEVGEGTGLGMSIVHGIITNHSGDIKIKTEIGIGTEITINLPRVTNNS